MLKMPITYENYDGDTVTEDFYFNMTKAEFVELELITDGGFREHLQKMIERNNPAEIIKTFKWIIGKSYGERSDDGKRFLKSSEILDDFLSTAAFHQLFMDLVTDAAKAAYFVNSLLPADLKDHLPKQMPTVPRAPDADILGVVPANELVDEELLATRNTPPEGMSLEDDVLRKTLEAKGLPHEEIDKILGI